MNSYCRQYATRNLRFGSAICTRRLSLWVSILPDESHEAIAFEQIYFVGTNALLYSHKKKPKYLLLFFGILLMRCDVEV